MDDDEIVNLIALTTVPKIGPVLAKQLIQKFGNAKEIFQADFRSLIKTPKVGPKIASNILNANTFALAKKELQLMKKNKIRCCTYLDQSYPLGLKHIPDAPLLLFYKGNIEAINEQRKIGIIGTRSPTNYGQQMLTELMQELSSFNPVIISGLAYGIDTYAHNLALKNGMKTYGILGNGLKHVYPRSNLNLVKKMIRDGGVITEFTFHSQAEREHFPMRNRIIAALSDAIIVVESKKTGGSMITADFANQYNKDVFAIPGKNNDPFSEGCNFLIKSHRAHLLQNAKDLSYVMGWDEKQVKSRQPELFIQLNEEESKLIKIIREFPQIEIDGLALKANISLSKIAELTLNLEFKGIIRPIPGKRFTLI